MCVEIVKGAQRGICLDSHVGRRAQTKDRQDDGRESKEGGGRAEKYVAS